MALNGASHNVMGIKTGPITGPPPPPSEETASAVLEQASTDPVGNNQGGKDGGDQEAGKKVKSAKELERERKKLEKQQKFLAKKAKSQQNSGTSTPTNSKAKEKKPKQKEEELPEYVEETPAGEKKILKPLDDAFHKAYNPKVVESAWYSWWEKQGFFEPEFGSDGNVKKEGYFVIPEPPPNVTGQLHMGHALPNALQDLLIRWNRMKGLTTVWVPGCDHAGIATQAVIENMLWRREKKTKYDVGREGLVKLIWDWKDEYHHKINAVLKRMGGSYDWTREAFTMDDNLSAAVRETFVRLHEEGTIYRANRLVNWCCRLNTAISNLEVDSKEVKGRTLMDVPGYERKVEFGVLTHFCYEMEETGEKVQVATTRPETMLGDSAIAVHPKDERYKHLVGKYATHPFIPGRRLKVVADDYVEMDFGTGAVKITPAHDANDFAIGKRHDLEFINILNDDGTMNHNAGPFEGQKRFDVRYKVIQALKDKGLYVKWEDNDMIIPLCSRSKDIIEPLIKPQWYMRMRELADAAIKVVEDGEMEIKPDTAKRSYFRWMEGIQDWCLSRQLWWGHQIPAYFITVDGEQGDETLDDWWVSGRTEEEAMEKAKKKFPGKNISLKQDPDVLDTWFSSGLWPFSTLGWPKQTHDLETLYPTSVLETGWDILFFWVARMVMFGVKMTGKVPFKEVYCHSLVRDSEGRKMSKSLGNVIDPVDVMDGISLEALNEKLKHGNLDPRELERATKYQRTSFPKGIPECGADALRFSLISYTTGGGDINFDVSVIHGYRRFCNKIYQATKYVLGKLEDGFVPQKTASKTGKESLAEKWILHKYAIAAKEINQALADRKFSEATGIVYQYWYTQLCDVYIENSKTIIQEGTEEEQRSAKDTLYTALEGALTMIHPFMPFVTEELWQRLPRRPDDSTPSIVKARYPTYDATLDDPEYRSAAEAYDLILDVSRGIRSLMAEYSVKDSAKLFTQTYTQTALQTCQSEVQSIKSLSGKGISSISILSPEDARPAGCVTYPIGSTAAVFLEVKGRVDIDAEIEKAKKKMQKATEAYERQKKRVDDPEYQSKVEVELQEVEKKKMEDFKAEAERFEAVMKQFEILKLE